MTPMFANSATVRAAERLMLRGGSWTSAALRVRYGFFIHPVAGPVLIDTGYGPTVTQGEARSGALKFYTRILRPELHAAQSPEALLARHGLKSTDVTTIIVTHFHADHVSELNCFPQARLILDLDAFHALGRLGALMRLHYGIFMELLPGDLERRALDVARMPRVKAPCGLPDGFDLFGDASVLGVPLPGHGHGHFGVCFANESPPLLYGVDTQWLNRAILEDRAPGYPAQLLFSDKAAVPRSNAILRTFCKNGGRLVLCHDPERTPYDLPEAEA